MIMWIFRVVALVGTPILTYFQVSNDIKGIAFGFFIGLAIIGMEYLLESVDLLSIIVAIVGGAIGIIVAKLTDYTVVQIDNDSLTTFWFKYNIIFRYALALLGMILAVKKLPEADELDKNILTLGKRYGKNIKILDLSSIVDGRILDICETRFISGSVITPRFVVQRLHELSESSDPILKAKGRRGLDILARLQESKEISFKVVDKDIRNVDDISIKIIKVAQELGSSVITSDFDLNKLGALENVPVLNINDLSSALKPVVLPGEDMSIFIMKEGKEKSQGVGYLDDGTMVVIEDGKQFIGRKIEVAVQSILQTSQGRIIFTKIKNSHQR